MSELGSRIRDMRKDKNLTLQELAKLVSADIGRDIHYTTIGKIERSERRPSGDILIALANSLNCTVHYLTGKTINYVNEFQVPVIAWREVSEWEEAVKGDPSRYVFSGVSSSSAYALELDELEEGYLSSSFPLHNAFIVVQPNSTELMDGHLYLIAAMDGSLSLNRFRSEPPRLEAAGLTAQNLAGAIGSRPFQVMGRVGWISGDL